MAPKKRKSCKQRANITKRFCKNDEGNNESHCIVKSNETSDKKSLSTLTDFYTTCKIDRSKAEPDSNPDPPSSDCSEWEDVEENVVVDGSSNDEKEPVIPKEGVEITLQLPNARQKRPKKQFDLQAYFRRRLNRFNRELQEAMHQVHLLCLLAYGFCVHHILNEDIVRAVALSLIPAEFHRSRGKAKWSDVDRLDNLLIWFGKTFRLKSSSSNIDLSKLLNSFHSFQADGNLIYCCMFLVCIRVVGYDARLVLSFQPLPVKPNVKSGHNVKKQPDLTFKLNAEVDKASTDNRCQKELKPSQLKKKKTVTTATDETTLRRCSRRSRRGRINYSEDGVEEAEDEEQLPRRHHSCKDPIPARSTLLNEDGTSHNTRSSKKSSNTSQPSKPAPHDTDDDFEVEVIRISNSRSCKGFKRNRKAVSPDGIVFQGRDQWVEVYIQSTKCWCCIDCIASSINRPQDIEASATKPLAYVVAFDNDGHVKDVTQRYASDWLLGTRKLRVDPEWWAETLRPYSRPKNLRDRLEDEKLEEGLLRQPLPNSVAMFKNHPLYALKRHLLKFEGIYPTEAVPVGFIKGEPIYSRECVRTLHSRETWLKDARLVRCGETPYKVVKARPKWNRGTGEFQTDLPLELFGEWQTEDYVAPPARDGKVPRNDYGNVELFKPSMLPKGTIHLQIPALNRVAKKLGIDCAPAMTGWDFHGMGSHPVFDGWVVCEEFKDTLLDAWNQEQALAEEREKQKREKRVYTNWRRLIRGLLIKERIRIKYALGPSISAEDGTGKSGQRQKKSLGKNVKPRKQDTKSTS